MVIMVATIVKIIVKIVMMANLNNQKIEKEMVKEKNLMKKKMKGEPKAKEPEELDKTNIVNYIKRR